MLFWGAGGGPVRERGAARAGRAGSAVYAGFSPKTPAWRGESLCFVRRRVGEGRGRAGPDSRPSPDPPSRNRFFSLYYFNFCLLFNFFFVYFVLVLLSTLSPPQLRGTLLFRAGSDRSVSSPRKDISPVSVTPGKRRYRCRCRRAGPGPAAWAKNTGKINPPARISSIRCKTGVSAGTAALPGARLLCSGHGHEWHRPRREERGRRSRGCFPGILQGPGRGHGPGAGSWARAAVPQPGEARAGAGGCVCSPGPALPWPVPCPRRGEKAQGG